MAGNKHVYVDAMRKGHNLAWDGRHEQAALEYRRAAAEFPEDAAANVCLGAAYLRLKHLPEALAAYEAVLRKFPEDLVGLGKEAAVLALLGRHYESECAYAALGDVLARSGMADKSLAAWREAATLMPDYPPARARLATALGRAGEPTAACQEYLAAARASSRAGKAGDAVDYVEQALLNDASNGEALELLAALKAGAVAPAPAAPSPARASAAPTVQPTAVPVAEAEPAPPAVDGNQARLDGLVTRARELQTQGQVNAAIAAYQEAAAAGIHRAEVEYNLGVLCYQAGRCVEALEHLSLTCKLPDYALGSHLTMGRCHKSQGDMAQALEHFSAAAGAAEATALPPSQVDDVIAAYRGAAEAHRDLGQPEEEAKTLGVLADLLTAGGWRDRAFAIRAELHQTEQVPGAAEKPIAETDLPEWQVVARKLASFDDLLAKQQFLAAIEECHDVISLVPSYLPVHYRLGSAYARQGRIEHAAEKYLTLGTLHVVRGELGEAIEACRLAASAAPRDTRPRSRLAKLYLQIGDPEKAMEELDVLGDLQLQGGNREEALATIRQIIALGPPDIAGYQRLLEQLEAQH